MTLLIIIAVIYAVLPVAQAIRSDTQGWRVACEQYKAKLDAWRVETERDSITAGPKPIAPEFLWSLFWSRVTEGCAAGIIAMLLFVVAFINSNSSSINPAATQPAANSLEGGQ